MCNSKADVVTYAIVNNRYTAVCWSGQSFLHVSKSLGYSIFFNLLTIFPMSTGRRTLMCDMLRNNMKTVNRIVKMQRNIIALSRGNCGNATSPVLAVPAVTTVDKQAREVT